MAAMPKKVSCRTLSVPEAGAQAFGLSRWGSYEAAKRGEIPTIRVGRLLRVPRAWLEQIGPVPSEPDDTAVSDAA